MRLMKEQITQNRQVTDLREPSKIIGIQIKRSNDYISITQTQYINTILTKEKMKHASPVATLLDHNVPIEPNTNLSEGDWSNPFAKLLGELQYLANATRPDITFAVNRLVSYTSNPSTQHYSMIKRILCYLARTKDYGITYRKSYNSGQCLITYADAAHGNADKKKSTTGIVCITTGGAILWKSKRQTLTALSSTEVEYVALTHTGTEIHWFWNLYSELGLLMTSPLKIRCDNLGAISMSENPFITQKSQHIDLKYHSIRQLVQKQILSLEACHDMD